MESRTFDTVVIGKGLIGAAAAKYLSQYLEKVAVVGPDEPENMDEAILFASHYDSGRVQRQIGRKSAMTLLNLQAVKQYPLLQKESGIQFHSGIGCLYINPYGKDTYLEQAPQIAKQHGFKIDLYENANDLAHAFPEFCFPDGSKGLFESAPSGHINPRLLIKAQLKIVDQNGGEVIREIVKGATHKNGIVTITMQQGKTLRAKRVLLTMGSFTNFSPLLETKLALTLKSETVILARVDQKEAQRLEKLPSLLYEIDTPALEGIYLIRPIQYPNGHTYLKMGSNLPEDIYFEPNLNDIQAWFRSGDSNAHLNKMLEALMTIMPNLKVEECVTKRCILTRTENHGNPYVGCINDHLFVAIGNGYSAMSSDAIGRLAATLIRTNEFPEQFDAEDFAPVFVV
jgi:glycine/D-amino acid oxidase-like deaminating enzyme